MKRKRGIAAVLLLSIMVTLVACTGESGVPSSTFDQEGIAPYALSDSEKYLLQSFGMAGTSQILSFHAPKEATTLHVTIYCLADNESWSPIGGGSVSIGADRTPIEQITGTFTMQLKENYSIGFHINVNDGGLASYNTDEVLLDIEPVTSATGFLQEFQTIEINTEIPVALMVYDSGTSMKSYTLQDYFEPAKFDGMDLVQVVTLEFSDD